MASRSPKPKPPTSSQSSKNAGEPSIPPVEVLASLASTIYAGGRDDIDPARAVEIAFDIWSKSKGRLALTVQQPKAQGNEDVPHTAPELMRKITGQTSITRAWRNLEKFVKDHANHPGMVSGTHPDSNDVAACESLLELYRKSSPRRDVSRDWQLHQFSQLQIRFREWWVGLPRGQRQAGEKKRPGRPRTK